MTAVARPVSRAASRPVPRGRPSLTLGYLVQKLFGSGEQGFTQDPYDYSGLFQDYGGITPVTIPGQPVGLILDKSKGATLGNDLRSLFSIGMIGAATQATFNATTGDGVVSRTDAANMSYVSFPVIANSWLKVGIKNNSATASISVRDTASVSRTILPGATIDAYLFNATGEIRIYANTDGSTGNFAIQYIKQAPGNHSYQSLSSMRALLKSLPVLGPERITNGNFANGTTGWLSINGTDETVSGGFLNFSGAVAANPNVSQVDVIQPGKSYEVSFRIANRTAGAVFFGAYAADGLNSVFTSQYSVNGSYKLTLNAPADANGFFGIRVTSGTVLSITDISVKEITSYSDSKRFLEFDKVDDKLTVNLPTQLTGCTVVRAIPNVGTQILTNQTIATPYNDSTDHSGLIVINRALTTAETEQITKLFNSAAGV